MTDRKMFRYVIPVDDQVHVVTLTGDPVAVDSADTFVEFWAEFSPDAGATDRAYQVFGTGQPLPGDAVWVGTCPRTPLGLVWHLFERKVPGDG